MTCVNTLALFPPLPYRILGAQPLQVEQGDYPSGAGFDAIGSRSVDGKSAIHLPRIDIFPGISPSASPATSNPPSI
jgi:hypothetical protein